MDVPLQLAISKARQDFTGGPDRDQFINLLETCWGNPAITGDLKTTIQNVYERIIIRIGHSLDTEEKKCYALTPLLFQDEDKKTVVMHVAEKLKRFASGGFLSPGLPGSGVSTGLASGYSEPSSPQVSSNTASSTLGEPPASKRARHEPPSSSAAAALPEGIHTPTVAPLLRVSLFFGKKEWLDDFGYAVDAPEVPQSIREILPKRCPFSATEQKIEDTHMLFLVPSTVLRPDSIKTPVTFNNCLELMKCKQFLQSDYRNDKEFEQYRKLAEEQLGDIHIAESYWVLMRKELLEGSGNMSYSDQEKFLNTKGQNLYRPPRMLEAAIAISIQHKKGLPLLCGRGVWTRCEESVRNGPKKVQMIVGDLDFPHLAMMPNYIEGLYDAIRVAAVRKF